MSVIPITKPFFPPDIVVSMEWTNCHLPSGNGMLHRLRISGVGNGLAGSSLGRVLHDIVASNMSNRKWIKLSAGTRFKIN